MRNYVMQLLGCMYVNKKCIVQYTVIFLIIFNDLSEIEIGNGLVMTLVSEQTVVQPFVCAHHGVRSQSHCPLQWVLVYKASSSQS